MSSVKPTNSPSWGNYLAQYLPSTKHMMSFISFGLQLTAQAFGNPIPSLSSRRSSNGTSLITPNEGNNNLEIIKANIISSSILHSAPPLPKLNPFQHLSLTPYSFEANKFSLLVKHLPLDLQKKIHATKSQKIIEKILENVEYQSIDYDENAHILAEESQKISLQILRKKGFTENEIWQIKQLSIIDQSEFVVEMLLAVLCDEEFDPKNDFTIVKEILTSHFTAFEQKETLPAILKAFKNYDSAQFTQQIFETLQKTIKHKDIESAQLEELHENIEKIMKEIDTLNPVTFALGKSHPTKIVLKNHALNEIVIFRHLHSLLDLFEKFFKISKYNYSEFQAKQHKELLTLIEALFFFETVNACSKKEIPKHSLIYRYFEDREEVIQQVHSLNKLTDFYYNHQDADFPPVEQSSDGDENEEISIPKRPKGMTYQEIVDDPALADENLTVPAEHHYLTYGMALIAGLSVIFTLLAQCKVKPNFPTRTEVPETRKKQRKQKEEQHLEVIPTFSEMLTHIEKKIKSCIASSKCETIASLHEETEKHIALIMPKYSELKSEIEKKILSFSDHIKMVVEKELKNSFTKQIQSALEKHPNYDIIAIINLPEVKALSTHPLFEDYLVQNKTKLDSLIYDVFIETFQSKIRENLQSKNHKEDDLIRLFNTRNDEKGTYKAWTDSTLFQDYCKEYTTNLNKFVRETIQAMLKANTN